MRRAAGCRAQRKEGASVAALEAIVLVLLFCFATAVMSADMFGLRPAFSRDAARGIFETQAHGLLAALADMPDNGYPTKLTRIIVECLNGNTTTFDHYLRTLPPGTRGKLRMQNLDGDVQLCGDEDPMGESAGAFLDVRVDWDPALVVPRLNPVDGTTMHLDPMVIPLHNGYAVQPDVPVVITAQASDGTTYTAATSFRTGTAPHATVSLRRGGVDRWYWDEANLNNFVIRVNDTDNTTIPNGTPLLLHLPRTWSNVTVNLANSSTTSWWRGFNATQKDEGWEINATLNRTLTNTTADFNFFANRSSDAALFHVWASLGQGRFGTGNFIFRGNASTQSEAAGVAVGLYPSIPPVLGSNTVWALTFANPSEAAVNSVTILKVTIHQPGNLSLFDNTQGGGAGGGSGWSVVDASTLQWSGMTTINQNSATYFAVSPRTLSAAMGVALDNADGNAQIYFPKTYSPATAPRFDNLGTVRNLTERVLPSVFGGRIPPTNGSLVGYPTLPPPNPGGGGNPSPVVCSGFHIQNNVYRGCSGYDVNTVSLLLPLVAPDAARGAVMTLVNATPAVVQPGSTVLLRGDFSGLFNLLSQNANVASVSLANVSAYVPWAPQPLNLATWPTICTTSNLGNSSAVDFRCDVPSNAVYGTYPIVATARVFLKDGATLDVRTAGTFGVGRSTAWSTHDLYTVTLLVWMLDWT